MTNVLPEDQIADFILTAMPLGTDSWARRNLVYGALHAVNDDARANILGKVLKSLAQRDFAEILKLAPFRGSTWKVVDALDETSRKVYWADVSPDWRQQSDDDLNSGIERLLEAKRPRAAFAWVRFSLEKIRPALLFRLLSEIATGNDEPPGQYRLEGYHITEAFKRLDASGEFSTDQMAGLEFPYIETLARERGAHGARGIHNLELYMESHPELFAEVVSWVFKRSDGAEDPETMKVADSELVKSRAERGYRLLDSLERIPGRNTLGEIDTDELLKWLTTVRQSCAALGRQVSGDITLGELIANAPLGADDVWPCEPVRNVLERMQSTDIAHGIHTGLYNLRGIHSRGEGGDQEREIATRYRRWTTALEFSHPFVASILKSMADSYEQEARGQDTEAKVERRLR